MTNLTVTQLRKQIADLKLLEIIEDKLDVDEIKKTAGEDEGKELISWEEIKAKHGFN